jgi:hypothetical protein
VVNLGQYFADQYKLRASEVPQLVPALAAEQQLGLEALLEEIQWAFAL